MTAYSDCSSAITRAHQSLSLMGPAVEHLQHGSLLLEIRVLSSLSSLPVTLTWTPSHPERKKLQSTWTESDWGIHMADAIAGPSLLTPVPGLHVYQCDSEDVHAAIMLPGTWHWKENARLFHGSLAKRAQRHSFLQYTQKRDIKRIYANEPTRWSRYNPSLMAMLTRVKHSTPRQRGRRIKNLFDWMAHASNISKGSPAHRKDGSVANQRPNNI
jgi:hypothetical protein